MKWLALDQDLLASMDPKMSQMPSWQMYETLRFPAKPQDLPICCFVWISEIHTSQSHPLHNVVVPPGSICFSRRGQRVRLHQILQYQLTWTYVCLRIGYPIPFNGLPSFSPIKGIETIINWMQNPIFWANPYQFVC